MVPCRTYEDGSDQDPRHSRREILIRSGRDPNLTLSGATGPRCSEYTPAIPMGRQWIQTPRTLLLVLALITAASVSALVWFGWQLVEEEQDAEAGRAQARLEEAADASVARARTAIAREAAELTAVVASGRLAKRGAGLPAVIEIGTGDVRAIPLRLLFYPVAVGLSTPRALQWVEALEFQEARWRKAAQAYRGLTTSSDPSLRGEATLRLARLLRLNGEAGAAREAYQHLAALDHVRVTGGPAGLVAIQALAGLDGSRTYEADLRRHLLDGRWVLSRGEFEHAWAMSGPRAPPVNGCSSRLLCTRFSPNRIWVWDGACRPNRRRAAPDHRA